MSILMSVAKLNFLQLCITDRLTKPIKVNTMFYYVSVIVEIKNLILCNIQKTILVQNLYSYFFEVSIYNTHT